jgi:hypothetical protein
VDVSDLVYEMFEADRQAARDAVRVEAERLEHYPAPAGQRIPQLYTDFQTVYRSPGAGAKDYLHYNATDMWPTPNGWRRAISWRRRREI